MHCAAVDSSSRPKHPCVTTVRSLSHCFGGGPACSCGYSPRHPTTVLGGKALWDLNSDSTLKMHSRMAAAKGLGMWTFMLASLAVQAFGEGGEAYATDPVSAPVGDVTGLKNQIAEQKQELKVEAAKLSKAAKELREEREAHAKTKTTLEAGWDSERVEYEKNIEVLNGVIQALQGVKEEVTLQNILTYTSQQVTKMLESAKPSASAVYDTVSQVNTSEIKRQAKEVTATVMEAAGPMLQKVSNTTQELLKDASPHMQAAVSFAVEKVSILMNTTQNLVTEAFVYGDRMLKSKAMAQAKAAFNKWIDEVVVATVIILSKSEATQPFANQKHAEMIVKGCVLLPLLALPLFFCLGRASSKKTSKVGSDGKKVPAYNPSQPVPAVYIGSKKQTKAPAIPASTPIPKVTENKGGYAKATESSATRVARTAVPGSKRVGGLVKTKGTVVASPTGERVRMP